MLALALLGLSTGAVAEDLEAAWQAALANDLGLQASQSEISAAEAGLAAAKASRLPTVSANALVSRFDDTPAFDFSGAGVPATLPLFGNATMEMADARVTLPLYTGGMVSRGIDAAEAMLSAQQYQSAVGEQQVKLSVARRYIDVLRAQSALKVADSTTASLRAHLADVQSMFESGAVARNDYLAAAVSLADSEQRLLQAQNGLDIANAAYNRALGRSLDSPVNLDEQLPNVDASINPDSLESLTALALANRDELGGLQAAADAYQSQSDATRGETRPQLAMTGGYVSLPNDFLNQDDYWMIGIGVKWDLFDGGQSRNKANALQYKARAVTQQRSNLQSMIELEVRQAWLRLKETRERTSISEQAVAQAEENLRVVRDRYRNGEGTNTEVLDAEALRSRSHSNFDNATLDARLALYELARGVGRL